tara:strand:- start:7 stop:264 length:258 start_codon:yes stop_codon:yes gene_type:complete
MADFTITLNADEVKAMTFVCTDTDEYITNAAKVRAHKAIVEIVRKNVAHCNANSVTIATGESAQITQAFDLGVVKTATQRNEDAP